MAIKFTDNSDIVKRELEKKILKALSVIGEAAEGYAKEDCPVDTGRLRNSITYATHEKHSKGNTHKHPKGKQDARPSEYEAHAKPEKNCVCIGTNVEYAQYVEFRSLNHTIGKAHFLRDAVLDHKDEYKDYAETILKAD